MTIPYYDQANDEILLYAQCHCRKQTFQFRVARERFPLRAETCHCLDCRQITGLLANDFLMLRNELRQDIFDVDNLPEGLIAYTPKRVTWYFCQTCGCHLVQSSKRSNDGNDVQGKSINQWYVSSGVVYPLHLPESIGGGRMFERVRHSWVRTGLDQAGLARFMLDGIERFDGHDDLTAKPLPPSAHDRVNPQPGPTEEEQRSIDVAANADSIPIQCRCGYVRLQLQRPSWHEVGQKFHNIVDGSRRKWRFNICLCNSCRTTTGFEGGNVVLFSTHHHIVPDEGHAKHVAIPKGYSADALQGDVDRPSTRGLCTYVSSAKILRRFCPCCGSSVFIDFKEFGPELCDVHLGNIRAPLRALWSAWTFPTGKISWLPYGRDRQLAEQLRLGYAPEQTYELDEKTKGYANAYSGQLIL